MKKPLFIVLFLILFTISYGEELPLYASIVKNYPSSMVIPKWSGRIGINFGKVNDTIDVFNFREEEIGAEGDTLGIGDYDHYGIYANLGISYDSMLSGTYLHRFIKYGHGTVSIHSYDVFFRKSFNSVFSIDLGFKGNIMDSKKITNVDDINFYIRKHNPNAKIEIDEENNLIWFVKQEGDEEKRAAVYKSEDPYVSIYNSYDNTKYIRFSVGKAYYNFYPNVFIEYGKTKIHGKIDTNLKNYVPRGYEDTLPSLPVNLNRNEQYLKIGANTFIRTPFNTLTFLEYYYITIDRDSGLGYEHSNHVFRAEVNYFATRHFVLFVGGIYLHRQLNGIIPFLYNKYTQTTFDHKYGWAEAGLIFMW